MKTKNIVGSAAYPIMPDGIDLERLTLTGLQALSEAQFRKEVFIPMLGCLRAHDIQDLQGNNEFGIDVYFSWYDIYHIRRHFGVQLKIGDLTATRQNSPSNVVDICRQLKMAFGRPILVADGGKTQATIDGFYVVTTGNITENARQYIRQHGQEYAYIQFLTGANVLEVLEKRRSLDTIHTALRSLDSTKLTDLMGPR